MKVTRRKIELTVEKSGKFITRRRTVVFALCPVCERRVEMLSPDEAAKVAGITSRAIYRLIEENRIHFIETEDGQLLVCPDSLSL